MCSVLCDSFWRLGGLGSKEKCNLFFVGIKALVVYDIVSDFLYWDSIREFETVPLWMRWAVFVFACAGFLVDAIGSCRVCRNSVPDSWGKDTAEASNRYRLGQKKLALVLLVAEDIPQLCLSTWITFVYTREVTTWYIVAVIGTLLNFVRILVTSCGYILCERHAVRIMRQNKRSSVRVRCCGCTLQTYEWEAVGYFGEMGRPTEGSEDVRLCGC